MARSKKDKPIIVRKATSAMRAWPGPLVFSLLVAAAAVHTLIEVASLSQLAETTPGPAVEPLLLGLPWPWLAGAIALVLIPILQVFWRSRMSRYRVCTDRLIEIHGLLGRQNTEMATADIREVLVRRTFGQRLLGLGDVVALGDRGPSVQFRNVSGPNTFARLIEDVRAGRLPGESKSSPAADDEGITEEIAADAASARTARTGRSPAEAQAGGAAAGGGPQRKAARSERPAETKAARKDAKKQAAPKKEESGADARDELWKLLEEQAAEQEKQG